MKKSLVVFALVFFFLGSILTTNKVYTNIVNPMDDHSGAPPSNITCSKSGCHDAAPPQDGSGIITITADSGAGPVVVDDNFLFQLGQTYDITVSLPAFSANRYGFQITMLDNSFTSPGNWAVAPGSSASANVSSTGPKTFFEHKNASTINSWTLEWTAPTTDPGPLGVYAVANLANSNNLPTGDTIYKVSHTINSGMVSIEDVAQDPFEIELYPNPVVQNRFNLVYTNLADNVSEIRLFDKNGRVVQYVPGDVVNRRIHKIIQLNTKLESGIYFIEIKAAGQTSHRMIVIP